jgi:hypothetical protein
MKIGFIDHYLNNYHATKFLNIFREGKAGQAVEIVAAYESDPEGTDDWCAINSVARASSPAEVVEKSDAIIVLSPNNVDRHLDLSKEALASGKPTMLDKALASTVSDARQIIANAQAGGAPIFSASSLRFSVELEQLLSEIGTGPFDGIFSRGFGDWRNYAVHSIQPALRLLGGRVSRVIDTGQGVNHMITVENDAGRRAFIEIRKCENQYEATPWQIGVLHNGNYNVITIKKFDEFYENMLTQAVQFFQTKESPVPVEEMLDEVVVEVSADSSFNTGGQWVDVQA